MNKFVEDPLFKESTRLAKRLGPQERKIKLNTLKPRTFYVPVSDLTRRFKNKNYGEKRENVSGHDNDFCASYLKGDICFSFKQKDTEEEDEKEEYGMEENQMFVYVDIGTALIEDYVRNPEDPDTKFVYNNADEFMKAINPECLKHTLDYLVSSKRLSNKNNKTTAFVGATEVEQRIVNDCNDHGTRQDLISKCTIEVYFYWFDQDSPFKADKMFVFEDKRWKMNNIWFNAYKKCLPDRYQKDNRIVLLKRIHQPFGADVFERRLKIYDNVGLFFGIVGGIRGFGFDVDDWEKAVTYIKTTDEHEKVMLKKFEKFLGFIGIKEDSAYKIRKLFTTDLRMAIKARETNNLAPLAKNIEPFSGYKIAVAHENCAYGKDAMVAFNFNSKF